jgi:hypothetical protein
MDLVNELKYENKSDKGTNLDAPTWENICLHLHSSDNIKLEQYKLHVYK